MCRQDFGNTFLSLTTHSTSSSPAEMSYGGVSTTHNVCRLATDTVWHDSTAEDLDMAADTEHHLQFKAVMAEARHPMAAQHLAVSLLPHPRDRLLAQILSASHRCSCLDGLLIAFSDSGTGSRLSIRTDQGKFLLLSFVRTSSKGHEGDLTVSIEKALINGDWTREHHDSIFVCAVCLF